MRNKKVFPIDRYHQKLLGLYQRQLKKWRNDVDNWNDRNLRIPDRDWETLFYFSCF